MRIFAIVDGSRRKAKPCAWLFYDEERREFHIELDESAQKQAPLMLELLAQRGEHFVDPARSLRWVQERIAPSGRQNIGQVLKAHDIQEYDEFALLMSSGGACSQDDFVLREVERGGGREGDGAKAPSRDVSSPEGGGEALEDCRASGSLMAQVGRALVRARKEQGVTQYELAQKTGIQQAAISRIENGRGNATLDVIESLAQGLGVQLRIDIEREELVPFRPLSHE